jgi:hypothetical protein
MTRDASVPRVTVPAPVDDWHAIVAGDPEALVTQTPQWVAALCAGRTWTDATRRYEMPDGRRVVLPLVRHRASPHRAGVYAGPPAGWGFGGPVADGGLTTADLVHVAADLAGSGALRLGLRPNPVHAGLWSGLEPRTALPRRAHVVDLTPGADEIWTRFNSETRRRVRLADRKGLTIEVDHTGRLLPDFFMLLELSRQRWNARSREPRLIARLRQRNETIRKWRRIARGIFPSFRLYLARLDERPAAAIIVLIGPGAHYTRGAMDADIASPTGANYALQWRAIQDALAAGAHRYHMGESGSSESLARFKEMFGAVPVVYHELRYERLPITAVDLRARALVKRVVGFREA